MQSVDNLGARHHVDVMASEKDSRPRVVVVGGGFAGIHAARGLRKSPAQLTVVDRFNHHLFQPLLYQVATAALSPGDIAAPIRALLRGQDAEILLADAVSVDVEKQELVLKDGRLHYDYLVLAAGARDAYFGHDEWAQHSLGLKTLEDALEIRRRMLVAYEMAEREENAEKRRELMTFVLVGGGATGVEMAGALAEIARQVLINDFRRINPADTRIVLIEGSSRLLPSYPEDLSAKAANTLRKLGVEVRLGVHVTQVDNVGVWVGTEQIRAQTVLWSAGVAASPLTASLGAPLDRGGRVKVTPELTVPGHPNIFVAGDMVSLEQDGKPIPGVAPAAMQEGSHVAKNVARAIQGQPLLPFRYWDRGTFAVVGRGSAVGVAFKVKMSGLLAWLAWLFIHIMFLVGFRNRLSVLFNWAYAYLLFRRGARLIYGMGPDLASVTPSPTTVEPAVRVDGPSRAAMVAPLPMAASSSASK